MGAVRTESAETAGVDLEELKTELDEYGFVLINNLIPEDQALRMAERIMELMSKRPDADKAAQGLSAVFNFLEPDEYEMFLPMVTHPVYLELARHVLGPGFQMAEVGVRWLKPGAPGQNLHADVPVGWFVRNGLPVPEQCMMLNCMWMLTEFTKENGGTVLIPFSQFSRRVPRPGVQYRHLVYAEGPPGSIVIFKGNIWHGGGANTTPDKHRVGVSSGFYATWLDPSAVTNWHLMKRSVRDRMPPMVQEMNRNVVDG
jgi:ectoine hydroxylase-related dioxygenase (phytanoyl-CoA dioxygenase family)